MQDLASQASAADFQARAIMPARELGAYEALWAKEGTSFKTLAAMFQRHPESLPSDFVPPSTAQRYALMALEMIRAAGIGHFGIRVHGAGEYPEGLRDARHPVELLYFQGRWDIVRSRCVAIVGTRHPSAKAVKRAEQLARRFVADDFTVVSGLARGIDTCAHKAALNAGGRTLAVLGTPITSCYPPENRQLQRRIADEFLIISQVPVVRHSRQGLRRDRWFPERNATMSALTDATVIVAAGDRSGALIQARHAIQQGRKLFILNSCFENSELTWPARYLEKGAIRVSDFDEIRAHLAARAVEARIPLSH
ncbi:DNA-binding protein [Steroidobacter denitrificans]|uniref:DNA-binding protein n=1 Tax=Steroidobacter denitrificans TaxID=465721 RepID=A0A127F7B2_STEDE|nr:DNA-processing protein DprA [Steroidobacter denitrificans]AMN46342.1 DNA-binding protein [Steroidobacter denitrificans]